MNEITMPSFSETRCTILDAIERYCLKCPRGNYQTDYDCSRNCTIYSLFQVVRETTEKDPVGTCQICGSPLYESEIGDYKYECLNCDEDFYGFEQEA